MDPDKTIGLLEEYARGYTFYILECFEQRPHPLAEQTTPTAPESTALNPKLVIFSFISALLGSLVLNGTLSDGIGTLDSASGSPGVFSAASALLVAAMFLNWIFVSLLVYLIVRVPMTIAFVDVLSGVLRVVPVAFAIAAYSAYACHSVTHFVTAADRVDARSVAADAFVIIEPVLVLLFLSRSLKSAGVVRAGPRSFATAVAVVVVFLGAASGTGERFQASVKNVAADAASIATKTPSPTTGRIVR